MVGTWILWAHAAQAKPVGWLADGAGAARFDGPRSELPLYRGPTTDYLPAVAVRVPVEGVERPALALLDVAGGWSRVSLETASALGLQWKWTRVAGVDRRVATLDEVRLDAVVLERVRVEVVSDGPGLVLGFGAIDELAVAVLPSKGRVVLVPAADSEALVRSVGAPVDATLQPRGTWTVGERTFAGDGLTLRVPGGLRWGEAVVDGTFHLRTDLATSRVAPSSRLPKPVMRAGEPHHEVGARLGGVWLADTWIAEDPGLSDPEPAFAAALGYDVLFRVDLAVAPGRGLVAFAAADAPVWEDATPVAVAFAQERYAQEEARAAAQGAGTEEVVDERVEIGFSGPRRGGVELGDPGVPAIRDRNLDLAETLWRANRLDEAIPYYLAASRYAGDHCGAHLLLGERRLAWSGEKIETELVAKLVLDPVTRSAVLWDAWTRLDLEVRRDISEGKDAPAGTVQVYQPPECRTSWGLMVAVQRARGDRAQVERTELDHLSEHASLAYARGLAALADGRYGGAEPLIGVALSSGAVPEIDATVAMVRTLAGLNKPDEAVRIARDIPGYPTDHPLVAALGVLQASRSFPDPADLTWKVVRADERWLPARLVHALATGERPPVWDPAVEARLPSAPQVICQKAVYLALSGDVGGARYLLRSNRWEGEADWWAASAVVAHLAGDGPGQEEATRSLRLRFPLLPVTDLGLPPIVPPPPPPAPPPPKKKKKR